MRPGQAESTEAYDRPQGGGLGRTKRQQKTRRLPGCKQPAPLKRTLPRAGANEKTKRTRRRRTAKIFATKRQRYPAWENRNSAFCRRHPQTKPFRQNKRPDCCTERFFCYLCLDDSPACGLFALLHVKTATFKCRGEGARMLRELSAHGPATRGSDLLVIETARYGRGFLVSVFGMGCCRPSREYGYLGACAFLFRKRRPGHTDRRLNVASLLFDSSWSM